MYYNNKENYDCNRFDYENENRYNSNNKRNCCVRRVEETFCCPSYYYEEEKTDCKENKKQETYFPCYEGYITLYPKHSYFDMKKDEQKHNICNNHNSRQNNDCESRNNNRCGFCGLFSRW